ncbi:unnamed protein product, partial [Staurois parvus]
MRDIAGAKNKVSEEEIPEQRCKVFPSVAQGTACGAETLPRATLGNTSREVNKYVILT